MNGDVSVVVPTYRAPYLTQAIASVLSQTLKVREIIVVDSSPGITLETLKPFEGAVTHLAQSPKGVSAARNFGIEAAKGEYIALLDADDFWLPKKLELQIAALQSTPEVGFSFSPVWNYCDIELTDVPTDPYLPSELVVWLRDNEPVGDTICGSVYELLLTVNCVATSSVVARRNALLETGLFDESFKNGEDHDLWLRLARLFPAAVVGYPTSRYRVHGTGLSGSWESRARLFYQYNVNVLKRHMAQFPSFLARKAIASNYASYAYYLLCHLEYAGAEEMAGRSLATVPNLRAARTYFEARYPNLHSRLSRILGRRREISNLKM